MIWRVDVPFAVLALAQVAGLFWPAWAATDLFLLTWAATPGVLFFWLAQHLIDVLDPTNRKYHGPPG